VVVKKGLVTCEMIHDSGSEECWEHDNCICANINAINKVRYILYMRTHPCIKNILSFIQDYTAGSDSGQEVEQLSGSIPRLRLAMCQGVPEQGTSP